LSNSKKRRIAGPSARSRELHSFRRLPSFRLYLLALHSERLHEQHYKEHFGLNLREGRVIGVVGAYGMASFRHPMENLNFGRSRVSLLIKRLIKRGLLTNVGDSSDKRITKVALTVRGRAIHKSLNAAAASLNREWFSAISKQDRKTFSNCLDILTTSARSMRKRQE
jgi:DNA-binding MarR family transcriptional regulator